jgi:hypothetical protein
MEEIFGNIYCWLEFLFGQNLGEYLWGYTCDTLTYDKNLFNVIGLVTVAVSFVVVILYYFVINHTRFAQWWHWLITLGVSGAINLFIAYGWSVNDFLNGTIGDCLMYIRDANGNVVTQLINESDCWGFGVANMFVATMFFIIFSFIFKRLSSSCKHTPWKSLFLTR